MMVGLNIVPVLVVPLAAKLVVLWVAYYGRSLWFVSVLLLLFCDLFSLLGEFFVFAFQCAGAHYE